MKGKGKNEVRDFLCIARHVSGSIDQFLVRNVGSIDEAIEELRFQVHGLTTVLWVVKGGENKVEQ